MTPAQRQDLIDCIAECLVDANDLRLGYNEQAALVVEQLEKPGMADVISPGEQENALRLALYWCVKNDGECLFDHQKRLKSYRALLGYEPDEAVP